MKNIIDLYKNSKRRGFIYKIDRRLKKHMKFIPIVGVIFLLLLFFSSQNENSDTLIDYTDTSTFDFINSIFLDFTNSFDFSDRIQLFTTILLIVTIWTGYKYWLMNVRVIRRNSKLVNNLVFAILLIVFSAHINFNSKIGEIFDWGLFLIVLYTLIVGTYLLMKIIDSFDLKPDLNCWGLRIFGFILGIIGFLVFASFGYSTMMINTMLERNMIFINVFWIAGLCIFVLGLFCEYRSVRRYGLFIYH